MWKEGVDVSITGNSTNPDSVGENSAFKDDFTAALLGDVGQRVYAGHQQSRRAENPEFSSLNL